MDDVTPTDDWAAVLQERFLSDLVQAEGSAQLTAGERACLQQVMELQPGEVHRLMIAAEGGPAADLAGFFIVLQANNKALSAFMFSPVAGLEKFANAPALRAALEQRLATPALREDILRFLPIEVRESLTLGHPLKLKRLLIETRVFANRQQSIIALQQHNLELIRERLLGLPSLRAVLDQALKLQLDQEFQGLDLAPQSLWVNSYVGGRQVSGMSLGAAALRFMARGAWPQDLIREYLSPTVPYVQLQAKSPTLDARMQALVGRATEAAQGAIHEQILAFWSSEVEGLSLRTVAQQVMGDYFFNELLQARHQRRVGPEQFAELKGLCCAQPPAGQWRPARLSLLEQDNAEVALAGLFNAYVPATQAELFLFSGRTGLQAFSSSVSFKENLLERLKDPRHIASLLPHVSRDQQAVLRNMHNVIVEVEMISGDLFEDRVQSIIDKQLRDLRYLMSTVKGTELDVNAVVDHALDVRTLLDPRLMQLSTQGRWSTGLALEREATPALTAVPDMQTLDLVGRKLTALQSQLALMVSARPSLDSGTLRPLLERPATDIVSDFGQGLRRFYSIASEPLSGLSVDLRLSQLRGSVLRHEVHVKRINERLNSVDAHMTHTALDRPHRHERRTLNGFMPDVCELALWLPDQHRSVNLHNSFLITQRGGTDPDDSGRVVLWTASLGLQGFSDLGACLEALSQRVLDKTAQWALLHSIHLRERLLVQQALQSGSTPPQWVPTVIEGHWLQICQQRVTQMNIRDIEFILEQGVVSHLGAQSLINQVASYWSAQAPFNVEGILNDVRDQRFFDSLPDWLKHARPEAQQEYADLMLRYRQAGVEDEHYSEGVPELLDYAREQLKARLHSDFPGVALEPDEIEISVVQYSGPAGGEIAGPAAVSRLTRSLTFFALSNFFNVQSGTRHYRSLGGQPLPAGLGDHYVRGLVRSLDLAARHEALLIEKLTPGHAGVARRQGLFAQQLPPQLLESALQARLKGELSDTAYHYLKHVLDSPDAKARELYQGLELVIRPLAFRAIEGRHPDSAQGMYWIGPASLDAGPQLLYVLYRKGTALTEYRHQGDFLEQLHKTPLLQDQILERLAPGVRKIYAHNGFFEPHIGYVDPTLSSPEQANPPATLATEVITENLLGTLYADTLNVRLAQVRTQAHSVAATDWASLEYLLSLLADIALLILPGKLSAPLMVWQARANLQSSVEAAAEDRWGEALFDFANALLMIGSARSSLGRSGQAVQNAERIEPPARLLNQEQRNGLRPYVANQVSLSHLQEDSGTGFYTEDTTGYQYIALDGQVYRVVPWQARWRIYIGEERDGPLVQRDALQRWVLDLNEPLQGGGQVLGTLPEEPLPGPSTSTRTITVTGMRDIARLHPQKAQVIREAHAQAIRYVSDCQEYLQSINEVGELSLEARRFLRRIFSVSAIEKTLLDKLKHICDQLLTTLLAPDYSPEHSTRYALFSSPDQRSVAMVSKVGTVLRHKAIFLGDQYFASADEFFPLRVTGRDGREFDRFKHSTAAILVHEFSHIALNTIDINYVGLRFPFEELLVPEATPGGPVGKLKKQMQDNRYRQLTTEIPEHELFKEKYTNHRGYLPMSFRLVHNLMKKTHCKTIEELRRKFVSDPVLRSDVILMNADSVALLITWLGYFKPQAGLTM